LESSEKQSLFFLSIKEHCLTEDRQAVARFSVKPAFSRRKTLVLTSGTWYLTTAKIVGATGSSFVPPLSSTRIAGKNEEHWRAKTHASGTQPHI